MATDKYQILGVSRDASVGEIRAAYLRLARVSHPDLNPSNTQAESEFKSIQLAYETLVHPHSRQLYDLGDTDNTVVYAHDQHWTPSDTYWAEHDAFDPQFNIGASHRGLRGILQNVVVAGLCLLILGSAAYGVYWMSESTAVTASLGADDIRAAKSVFTQRLDSVAIVADANEDDALLNVLSDQDPQTEDFAENVEESFSVELAAADPETAPELASATLDEFTVEGFEDSENPLVTAALEQVSFHMATQPTQGTIHWDTLDWQATAPDGIETIDLAASAESVAALDTWQAPTDGLGEMDLSTLVAVSISPQLTSVDGAPTDNDNGWSEMGLPAAPWESEDMDRPWEPDPWRSVGELDSRLPDMSQRAWRLPNMRLSHQVRSRRAKILAPATGDPTKRAYHQPSPPTWNSTPNKFNASALPPSDSLSSLYPDRSQTAGSSKLRQLQNRSYPRRPPTPPGLQTSGKYSWDPITGNLQTGLPTSSVRQHAIPRHVGPSITSPGYYRSPAIYTTPNPPAFDNGVAFPSSALTPFMNR